jgi:hypothetical protein
MGATLTGWAIMFALPFTQALLTVPEEVPFDDDHTNYTEYVSGFLSADEAVRSAAATLNSVEGEPEAVYATWTVCGMLHFYAEADIDCLDERINLGQLQADVTAQTTEDDSIIVVSSGYGPFLSRFEDEFTVTLLAEYSRERINVYAVSVWELRRIAP